MQGLALHHADGVANKTMNTNTREKAMRKNADRREAKRLADIARAEARCSDRVEIALHTGRYVYADDVIGGDRLKYPFVTKGLSGSLLVWLSTGPHVLKEDVEFHDGTVVPKGSMVWLHRGGSPCELSEVAFKRPKSVIRAIQEVGPEEPVFPYGSFRGEI